MTEILNESQIDKPALLRGLTLFAELSDESLHTLARLARVAVYPAGDEIVAQDAEFDEESDGIFLIVSGSVEVRRDSSDGTDGTLLMTLGPGEFFGEMSLLDGKPRSASVFSVEETQCLVLHRWDFMRELRKSTEIAIGMLAVLSQRLRAMDEAVGRT